MSSSAQADDPVITDGKVFMDGPLSPTMTGQ